MLLSTDVFVGGRGVEVRGGLSVYIGHICAEVAVINYTITKTLINQFILRTCCHAVHNIKFQNNYDLKYK